MIVTTPGNESLNEVDKWIAVATRRGNVAMREGFKSEKLRQEPKMAEKPKDLVRVAQVYQQVSQIARSDHDGSQGDQTGMTRAKRSQRAAWYEQVLFSSMKMKRVKENYAVMMKKLSWEKRERAGVESPKKEDYVRVGRKLEQSRPSSAQIRAKLEAEKGLNDDGEMEKKRWRG